MLRDVGYGARPRTSGRACPPELQALALDAGFKPFRPTEEQRAVLAAADDQLRGTEVPPMPCI